MAALIGSAITLAQRDSSTTWPGAALTAGFAAIWCVSNVAVILALGRYEGPVSVIVPLYNMSTLIAVGMGLAVLGEWKDVNAWRLLAGAVLIVVAGALAGTSVK